MKTAELLKGSRGREIRRRGAGGGDGPLQLRDAIGGVAGKGPGGRVIRHRVGRQLVDDRDNLTEPSLTVRPC